MFNSITSLHCVNVFSLENKEGKTYEYCYSCDGSDEKHWFIALFAQNID